MKILYIHQYFRTPAQGGALRSYFLAKALVEAGHEVELITAHNSKVYIQTNIEGIKVHYLPIAYDNAFSPAKRIKSFLKFNKQSIQLALSIKGINLCFATSTPLTVGFTALALKALKGIPFYFEVRDLWPEAPIQLGFIKRRPVQKLLYAFERVLYKQAEKVIALSPGMVTGIAPHKPTSGLYLIPNMGDCRFYTPTYTSRSNSNDLFHICYTGAMGQANRLEFLLAIAMACQEQGLRQVKFTLAGEGSEVEKLQLKAQQLGLKNIAWAGTLNQLGVRDLLATAHATYTSFDTFPILQTNSPNKFFDSLAAGKLTIVNTKGWLKELVEQHECGFYANPEQPDTFVKALTPYLEQPQLLQQAQQNARALAESQFSRQELCAKFTALFYR